MIGPALTSSAPAGSALDLRALAVSLDARLQRAFASAGGFGRLTPLTRGPLADSVTLLRVHARDDRPVGVLQVSALTSEGHADLVEQEVERGRAARAALGPRAGDVILEPLAWFEEGGRTCAAYPLCSPLPVRGWRRKLERVRLRRELVEWLHEAARVTRHEPSGAEVARDFARPLAALADDPRFGAGLRDGARIALERLQGGSWRPWHVLEHADLWEGNVLRWPSRPWWREREPVRPFVVIDWRGSRTRGHAIRDLLSVAQGLRLSPRRLRRELERHAWLLGCALQDTRGYLLAGVGATGLDLGCFEPRRWVDSAEAAWALLLEAVEA